jgi:hypothetical protein
MPNVSLNNVPQADIRKLIGTRAFSSGALATATDTTMVKSVSTITYVVDGVFCSKGATDNLWDLPLTIDTIQPGSAAPALAVSAAFGGTGFGAITRYAFCGLNAGGDGLVYWSKAPADADASVLDGSVLPDNVPDNVCIVGYVKIVTAAATVFTPQTTALGTGNTATYVNCSVIPSTLS